MNPAGDLVNKLWRLCAVLRKDGITYQQYVTELTYLLFLKMMAEQKREEGRIPEGMRWRDLVAAEGVRQLSLYRAMLTRLGDLERPLDRTVQAIFANAATFIREPVNLDKLVTAIDELRAGQYFTPRVLIGVLVRLMQPKPDEIVQDPAAGTGGFVIAAERAIHAMTDEYFALAPKQQEFLLPHALHGLENVQGAYRLLLMN
jgi:type I restriction enzyme M protein